MATPLVHLLILLVSALAWAGLDVIRKQLMGKLRALGLLFLMSAAAVPLFAAWTLVSGYAAPGPGYWLPALGSIALNVIANLAYLEAVRLAPLSLAAPLLSLTPAFTTIMAIPILGELPSARAVCGIVLVMAGAFQLHRAAGAPVPREAGSADSEAEAHRHRRQGVALTALTSFLWAITLPFDKLALLHASPGFHGVVLNAGLAVVVLAVLIGRGEAKEITEARRAPGLLTASVLVGVFALATQLQVLPHFLAGTVETLKRGVGNLGGVLFGRLFFGEPVTAGKLAAVLLMAAGVALILL
jgi:drug/metabolite transporter (DMT)-like permease